MNSEITSLQQKIEAATEITPGLVDSLIDLAILQMEKDVPLAYTTAQSAISQAQTISYKRGEALALIKAGLCEARQRKYDYAREFYNRALGIYESLEDEKGVAEAHAKLGNTNLHDGKYDEALVHYDQAMVIKAKLNDELGVADLNTNSGIVHGFKGDYHLALKSHMEALKTYELLLESSRLASSAINISLIYTELQNYEEALIILKRALSNRQQAHDNVIVGDLLNNIGNVYNEQRKYAEAIEMHQRALVLREQAGDKVKIASSYFNLGLAYKDTEQIALALEFYNRALSLFEELNEKRKLATCYNSLGELYFILGDYEGSHNYLNKGIKLAEDTGLKDQLKKASEGLAKLYAVENNYKEAYRFQTRFIQLDKEISNNETNRQLARMAVRYEIEQKDREAELERMKSAELQKAYRSLEEEKKRSEELLNNILPEEVSEELKLFGKTKARSFEEVTVMFADIQGFTAISEQLSAQEIVNGIDEYFEAFDKIVEKHGIEKIKTIGDAYLCASGIPLQVSDHAEKMIDAAKEFLLIIAALKRKREREQKPGFDFRIGIHTGPLVAGVVGIKKFAYDIWGDTVNTASRMEQSSEPNHINISESTYLLIKDRFTCQFRGEIDAKNKGKLKMYFVK